MPSEGKEGDLRREQRQTASSEATVGWEDRGRQILAKARVLNIAENGLALELAEPIPLRTLVHVRSSELKVSASCSVRHCSRSGRKFVVGVEFADGFKWHPPDSGPPPLKEEV